MREEQPASMSEDGEEEDGERWVAPDLGGGGGHAKIRGGCCGGAAGGGGAGGCGCGCADPLPPFSAQVLENVLENVLQFLTARRDRNAASLVCRSWYRAEAQTRADLFIGNCYAVSPSRAADRFRSARAVVLKGKPRFADFSLVPPGWGARFAPWATAMAPAYPWLEKLCLKRMTVNDDDLALLAVSFPNFRELVLYCCDGFGTAGLAAVAEKCR